MLRVDLCIEILKSEVISRTIMNKGKYRKEFMRYVKAKLQFPVRPVVCAHSLCGNAWVFFAEYFDCVKL